MLGVGLPELMVIMVVAVVVFGPERLPEFARQAGRFVRQMRNLAQSAQTQLREELGPEYADLELRDLDPRQIVRRHIAEAMEDDDEDDEPVQRTRRGQRPLEPGETPPYDVDAT